MPSRKLRQKKKRKVVHSDSGIDGLAVRNVIRVAEKKGLYLLFQDKFWAIYDKAKGNQIAVFYPSSTMISYKGGKPTLCRDWVHALDVAMFKMNRGSI